jgi:4-alpha-glucanotransferase
MIEGCAPIRRSGGGTTALDRLAARYGIEPGFRDARGEYIETQPETQIRLLGSMGVNVETEQDASTALAEFERAAWQSCLPPAIVARDEGRTCSVEAVLPAATRMLQWHVRLEDGGERNGESEIAGLELLSRDARSGAEKRRLRLRDLPYGYHRLRLAEPHAETCLIVAPQSCWLPDGLREGPGLWGIAMQLPLLRSARNWGIGDFGDLDRLVRIAAGRGCDVIGVNPLHQMFLDAPERASPYSPATRLYLNALYIDVMAVPEFAHCRRAQQLVRSADFQTALHRCRSAAMVDYANASALKIEILRLLFGAFGEGASGVRRDTFRRFRARHGDSLQSSSIFQALHRHFSSDDPTRADWRHWPKPFQDAASPAVRRFAVEHRDEVDFLVWLQFVADQQLESVADSCAKSGMATGLYRDLAVGCDRFGAEIWANPRAFMKGAEIGAPPDIFNPAGQHWGLPPLQPDVLRREAYRSFIRLIRANMRHAGGLRVDHVMGLHHLYCIPDGAAAARGAYVRYPLDDLVGILALESRRHCCLVVGEDLGTVPAGFRDKMAAANILSYRVLFFEQDDKTGHFIPPGQYPRLAVAVAGNHDLATLRGWWQARDIDLKASLGLYPSDAEIGSQRRRRVRDREEIVKALRGLGLLPPASEISAEQFTFAAHRFLACVASRLVVVQLDDMTGEVAPVNVPATSTEYPNWRRKYAEPIEALAFDDGLWRIAAILTTLRGEAGTTANEH